MKIRTAGTLGCVIALVCSVALGGGFKKSDVAADAAWVAHIDLSAVKDSELGAWVMQEMRSDDANRKLAAFKAIFGFDPRDDLSDVTLYGTGGEHGVVMCRGQFDPTQLETLVRASQDYVAEPYGEGTIHCWRDKESGKLMHAMAREDGVIVVSEELPLLKGAIDVLAGKQASLEGSDAFGALLPSAPVPLFIAVQDMKSVRGAVQVDNQPFQQASSGGLTISETGGNVSLALSLQAPSPEAATQMAAIAQGLIAFTQLSAAQQQQAPSQAAKLAQRIQVNANGTHVSIALNAPAADIVAYLQEQKARKEAQTVGGVDDGAGDAAEPVADGQ